MTAWNEKEVADIEAELSLKRQVVENCRKAVITDVSSFLTTWAKKCNITITNIYIRENSKAVYATGKYYEENGKSYSDDFIQVGFIDNKMFVYPHLGGNIDPANYRWAALIHFLHLMVHDAAMIERMYADIESIPTYFRCYEDYQKENGFLEFKLRNHIVD